MPPPRKIDLLPAELRVRLAELLEAHGFADIVDVTEELNSWLVERGEELRLGKSAVGEFSKALKDQREAFSMAETLLGDMDIEAESDMHRVLMQMIATSAVQLMRSVREEDGHLGPSDLMQLGRMLKDLMSSAGIREKLRTDERERIAKEAREAERRAQAERLDAAASAGRINADAAQAAREIMGFV